MTTCIRMLFIIFLPFFISACGGMRYQVFTMNSNLPIGSTDEFALETDSLSIAYSFAAEIDHITMGIFNTSSSPMFVNWRNSSVILNGQSTPMMQFLGYESEIIPPKSMVAFAAPHNQFYIENFKKQHGVKKASRYDPTQGEDKYFRSQTFFKDTSPLILRMHVQISRTENLERPLVVDHLFWLEQIEAFRSQRAAVKAAGRIKNGKRQAVAPDKFMVSSFHGVSPVILLVFATTFLFPLAILSY